MSAAFGAPALLRACSFALVWVVGDVCCEEREDLAHKTVGTDHVNAFLAGFDERTYNLGHTVVKESPAGLSLV